MSSTYVNTATVRGSQGGVGYATLYKETTGFSVMVYSQNTILAIKEFATKALANAYRAFGCRSIIKA